MLNQYPGEQLVRAIASGDLLNLPALGLHIYGHVRAIRKALDRPAEIDTKPEFVALAAEFAHLFEDLSEIIPGDWEDSAVARFRSLVLSDQGSDLLFAWWRWWHALPTPPTKEQAGEMLIELAGAQVTPA